MSLSKLLEVKHVAHFHIFSYLYVQDFRRFFAALVGTECFEPLRRSCSNQRLQGEVVLNSTICLWLLQYQLIVPDVVLTSGPVREICTYLESIHNDVEAVTFDGCTSFEPDDLQDIFSILAHCPRLARVSVRGCLPEQMPLFRELVTKCPNLAHLKLSNDLCLNKNWLLGGLFERAVKSLVEISFVAPCGMSDHLLSEVAKHCPGLKAAAATHSLALSDSGFLALRGWCPQVESVIFPRCGPETTSASVLIFCAKDSPVKTILIGGMNVRLDAASVVQIARAPWHTLTHLGVRLVDITEGTAPTWVSAVHALSRGCPRLCMLRLSGSQLRFWAERDLFRLFPIAELIIDEVGTATETPAAFTALLALLIERVFGQLRRLTVRLPGWSITSANAFVLALADAQALLPLYQRPLEVVQLLDAFCLNRGAVAALVDACPSLQTLVLQGAVMMDVADVAQILRGHGRLSRAPVYHDQGRGVVRAGAPLPALHIVG